MRPSFPSRITSSILKWTNFKKKVEKRANKPIKRSEKAFLPKHIEQSFVTKIQSIASKTVATFESKEKVSQTHLIFLHGGAYIFEAVRGHWDLAQKIVEKSFCRMTVLDYPLAPESTYLETFAMVEGAYEMLCEQYPNDNFVLMGDSAGASLALAFSQKLIHEKHHKLPIKNILFSPWLDLSMSNPEIGKFISSDHLLSVPMLKTAASKYAGGADQTQYLLSPINGEFSELPPTLVFYSNVELFYPDCVKLKVLATAENANFKFIEYAKMIHDWVVFPFPERAAAIDEVCAFLAE